MLTLAVPEFIHWVRETGGILVVDESRRTAHRLAGLEAVIWDELARPYPELVSRLAALLELSPVEAEIRLNAVLESWRRAGLLVEVRGG
jgi:hypothetical protein